MKRHNVLIAKRTTTLAMAVVVTFILPTAVRAASPSVVAPVMSCTDLLKLDFTEGQEVPIRLSTATIVEPSATGRPSQYCRVTGYAFPQVQFEVHLPTQNWTQRFFMSGCGGYCGAVSVPLNQNASGRGNVPFHNGEMAVASHDAGHVRAQAPASPDRPGPFADGLFALNNPGAVVDFAYNGVHKATVATKAVINKFYGQPARYSYYSGCSDGGRQGLQEAQRFPKDYDGIMAAANTIDVVETNTFYHGWNVRVNAAGTVPGTDPVQYTPILTSDRIPALHQAVLNVCANFGGGLKDMVRDPRVCSFDKILKEGNLSLLLSKEQIEAARLIWQGPVDETGAHLSAGDMPFGSEPGWVGSMVTDPGVPLNLQTSGDYQFSWDWPHYMARFGDPLDIDVRNMQFTRAEYQFLTQLRQLYTPTNPDLRPFAKNGGKLLMWHGWADTGSTPHHSLNYYDGVRRFVGESRAAEFMQLYMVPGMYHCNGGPRATSEDFLTPLMQWVEDGVRPDRVVINYHTTSDNSITSPIAMTRPVWPYPFIASYTGNGSPTDAANFVKASPDQRFNDRFNWVGISTYRPGLQLWCDWKGAKLECSEMRKHRDDRDHDRDNDRDRRRH